MNLLAGQSFQKQRDLESSRRLEPVGHEGNSPALILWQVYLEKALESPLDSKEVNQSILKEINPGYSLKGLMLKLNFQYFGHVM